MTEKIDLLKIFLLCPVPDEQKPISEYINLKKYLPNQTLKEIVNSKSYDFFSIRNKILSQIINIFLIFRWKEIENRLNQPTIAYEESSWYDGQIWEKTFSVIKNDKLINIQFVKPVLKDNFIFICSISFLGFLFFVLNYFNK